MKTAYYNGKIYTGELPLQEAFIVEDSLFSAVGENREILSALQLDDKRTDLKGAFVC